MASQWRLSSCSCAGQSLFLCLLFVSALDVAAWAGKRVKVTLAGGAVARGREGEGVREFRGLRYAKAARFEVPKLWSPPAGASATVWFGASVKCPQASGSSLVGREDCLFLDVYTPSGAVMAPVMVWIHGGGLTDGCKSDYGQLVNLVKEDGVVVVVINYRLNVFGFYSSANATEPKNLGLRDQIAALKWVKRQAASFGGDASRVTIFGESAGGLSVMALRQSPLARGLFHRAISQSSISRPPRRPRPWAEGV